MASYTMELRKVIYYYGQNEVKSWFKDYNADDYLTIDQRWNFLQWGLFDKDKLAQKIIDHYYMREIAFETPALFKHFAKVKMQEIMEEKIPLLYSLTYQYNPLQNYNISETSQRILDEDKANSNSRTINDDENVGHTITNTSEASSTSNGASVSSASSEGSSLKVSSDTPQGEISKTAILSGTYASQTEATENSASSSDRTESSNSGTGSSRDSETKTGSSERDYSESNSGTSSNDTTENITRSKIGNTTSYQKLIKEYRENIIAVEKDIIEALNPLFFGLF